MSRVHLWGNRDEELSVIHRLNNIVRYNTRNKINPETVAAHSFFTAYFVISICKEKGINDDVKLMALESAVIHDVPEVFINDITYDCKCLICGIEDVLRPYERDIVKQISFTGSRVLFWSEDRTSSEELAGAVVNLADILSVKQYALSELELGNETFKPILKDTEYRLLEAERHLENMIAYYKENSTFERNKQQCQRIES